LKELLDALPGAFWPCQYDNPANAFAYERLGGELFRELGPGIGALVGSVGSGGSLCGIGRGLKRLLPDLRVVAVDAVGSVLFNQPDRRRLQSGHGNSIVPGNLDHAILDEVHWLADAEAFNGCRELARRCGIFGGGSSGAVYIAASWVAGLGSPQEHVVAILPDRGDRYYRSVYSDLYMREHRLEGREAAAQPRRIRYGEEVAQTWSCATIPHDGSVPYFTPGSRRTSELSHDLDLVLRLP
jgi:cysteine synthase